jgi:hypothetical protein
VNGSSDWRLREAAGSLYRPSGSGRERRQRIQAQVNYRTDREALGLGAADAEHAIAGARQKDIDVVKRDRAAHEVAEAAEHGFQRFSVVYEHGEFVEHAVPGRAKAGRRDLAVGADRLRHQRGRERKERLLIRGEGRRAVPRQREQAHRLAVMAEDGRAHPAKAGPCQTRRPRPCHHRGVVLEHRVRPRHA